MRVGAAMPSNITKEKGLICELFIAFAIEEILLTKFIFNESLKDNFIVFHQIKLHKSIKIKRTYNDRLDIFTTAHSTIFVPRPTHSENFCAGSTFFENLLFISLKLICIYSSLGLYFLNQLLYIRFVQVELSKHIRIRTFTYLYRF